MAAVDSRAGGAVSAANAPIASQTGSSTASRIAVIFRMVLIPLCIGKTPSQRRKMNDSCRTRSLSIITKRAAISNKSRKFSPDVTKPISGSQQKNPPGQDASGDVQSWENYLHKVSRSSTRKFQTRSKEARFSFSSGVWAPMAKGPMVTMSRSGMRSLKTPHSNPPWTALMTRSSPVCFL